MTRKKAFLTHLAMSATLVAALTLLFVFLLFPLPYFLEDGGWNAIRLIAVVDVVVGPLLTLVVFNPQKSRGKLAFDLTVIGAAQAAALALGLWTVYTHSTQAVLYVDGVFYTVDTSEGSSYSDKYRSLVERAEGRPFYGVIDLPDDPARRKELQLEAMRTGLTLLRRAELLRPLGDPEALAEIAKSVRKAEKLLPDGESRQKLDAWAAREGVRAEDHFLVPLRCRYGELLCMVRKTDGAVAGFLHGVVSVGG